MAVASVRLGHRLLGVVRILKDLDTVIEDRDVLIVEDIVESGLTHVVPDAQPEGPRPPLARWSAHCSPKPDRRKVELPARYIGFRDPRPLRDRLWTRPPPERYRNLPFVAALVEPA
jgi:hypoxanthine phosphoribosyltransferase